MKRTRIIEIANRCPGGYDTHMRRGCLDHPAACRIGSFRFSGTGLSMALGRRLLARAVLSIHAAFVQFVFYRTVCAVFVTAQAADTV